MKKIVIGVSIGDPAGIGPELLVKSFSVLRKYRGIIPLVIGDKAVIKRNFELVKQDIALNLVADFHSLDENALNVYSPDIIKTGDEFVAGENSALCGRASFAYVQQGIDLCKSGIADALVTLPISKKAWQLAGILYTGHTELLIERLAAGKKSAMVMLADGLNVVLVTTHIPLCMLVHTLTPELILQKVIAGHDFMLSMGCRRPVIGVAAVNPHAGEKGLLGDEEEKVIKPALNKIRLAGIDCIGPVPADSIFRKALSGEIDMVAAMYHDQALIPLKTFRFEKLVNCTAGLPMPRTSPGHGTGFDIAYKNKADPAAFIEAYRMAARMARYGNCIDRP